MSNFYAQISDNVVVGVSQVKDTISAANMIPIASLTAVSTGDVYDPETETFSTPDPVSTPRLRLTKREFRNKFTFAEKQAIYTAAETSVDIRIFLDDLMAAEYIECDNSDTVASVSALETATLIGTGRADEILAGVTD